jgi:hypothetical protein
MKRYIEFPLEQGGSLVVEVEEPDTEFGAVAIGRPDQVAQKATQSFGEALARVQPAIAVVIDQLRVLQPEELTVEFGIKLNAAAGAFLASAGTEANFKVSIKWKSDRRPSP